MFHLKYFNFRLDYFITVDISLQIVISMSIIRNELIVYAVIHVVLQLLYLRTGYYCQIDIMELKFLMTRNLLQN